MDTARIMAVSRMGLIRAEEHAAAMADVIRRDVGFYGSSPGLVSRQELERSCLAQMRFVFEALAGDTDAGMSAAADTGVRRATAGVPLAVVMSAYRVGFRAMWEISLAEAREVVTRW